MLFSRPGCRAVLIDLSAGDELGEHRTHEYAVLEVVSGKLALAAGDRRVECESGTLAMLEPHETRRVEALESSRILLILAPWPGEGHYPEGEEPDPQRMPAQASVPPLPS